MKAALESVAELPRPFLREPWRILLKAAFALALLMLVLEHVDGTRVLSAIAGALPLPLVLAALLLCPNLLVQYAKWRLLLRRGCPELGARDAVVSLFAGFAFGLVTPARVGEFGGRAFSIQRGDKATLAALTGVDKFASLTVTVAAGVACSALLLWRAPGSGNLFLAVFLPGCLALALLVLAMAGRRRIAALAMRISEARSGWSTRARRLHASLAALNASDYMRITVLSLAFYCVFILQFVLLIWAFGHVPSPAIVCAASVVMLAKSIVPPLTLGELGIRESAAVFVYTAIGIPAPAALAASLLLFAFNVLAPALAGAAVLAVTTAQRNPTP